MKTWHALLVSVSLIVAGLIASGGPAKTASGAWGMVTGTEAYLFNSESGEVYRCVANKGGSTTCRRGTVTN